MQKALGGRWHLEERKSSQFSAWAYCLKGEQSKEEWESEGVDGANWGGKDLKDYPLPSGHIGGIVRIIGDLPPQGDGNDKNVWNRIREAIENGWTDLEICAKWPHEGIRCASAIAKYRILWDRQNAAWRDVDVTYITGNTGDGKTRYVMEKYGYNNVFRMTDYGGKFDTAKWDNYHGQDVVIFEEFRNSVKIENMLNWCIAYWVPYGILPLSEFARPALLTWCLENCWIWEFLRSCVFLIKFRKIKVTTELYMRVATWWVLLFRFWGLIFRV